MLRAVQLPNAANAQRGGFVALNVGAHLAQQVNQVSDFGFAGTIFQNGLAIRQSGSHQNVLGPSHGDFFEDDVRALQRPSFETFAPM